jgi:hypothetical protein
MLAAFKSRKIVVSKNDADLCEPTVLEDLIETHRAINALLRR